MSDDIIIKVEGLWKRYGLPLLPALRGFVSRLSKNRRSISNDGGPWALRDVSVEVKRGETLGIIGRNGAGKSTLLKILAGVTPPTRGQIEVRGRVFPMIELNAGIHLELTGRENVRLLGTIMGLSRQEVETKIPEIEEFTELGEWFDQPVRKYSSGMLARLGFGVAMNVDADVLLVDEVLSVGDITFQRKCLDRMEQLQNSEMTILFVSHSIRQVERVCDRALLLEKGRPQALGEATEVASRYYADSNYKIIEQRTADAESHEIVQMQVEDALVDILAVRLLDKNGQVSSQFYTGSSLTIEVDYEAHQPVRDLFAGFGIATIDSFYVAGFTSELESKGLDLQKKSTFRCTIKDLPLLSGIYMVHLKIMNEWGRCVGGGFGIKTFSVIVPKDIRRSNDYGLVRLNVEWP
jgi:lipopolysaccharide transport system ATP-binding protein